MQSPNFSGELLGKFAIPCALEVQDKARRLRESKEGTDINTRKASRQDEEKDTPQRRSPEGSSCGRWVRRVA